MAKQATSKPQAPTRQSKRVVEKRAKSVSRAPSEQTDEPLPPVSQSYILADPQHVNSARAGHAFLETRLLFVPEGADANVHNMASAMFQVSALPGMPATARQAVRSLAFMLEEMEESASNVSAREAMMEQLEYMREELRDATAGIKASVATEFARQMEAIGTAATSTTSAVKNAALKVTSEVRSDTTYRDALMLGTPTASTPSLVSSSVDSCVEARQAIMARQIMFDVPEDSPALRMSAVGLKELYTDAMEVVGPANNSFAFRVVERHSARGILCETLSGEAAAWMVEPDNMKAFIASMGATMRGAAFCPRNYTVIVFHVPVEFEPLDRSHLQRVVEENGIKGMDKIASLRWAKPIQRHDPTIAQMTAHLILTFQDIDVANVAIRDGMHGMRFGGRLLSKLLKVAKNKREPLRCLRCHGWNHMVRECPSRDNTCGTCGVRGHMTEECKVMKKTEQRCTPCGDLNGIGHASWDRTCPTFLRKCREQDAMHPQNAMQYFPLTERWTWITEAPQEADPHRYMDAETVSSGTRDRRGVQTQLMFKKAENFRKTAEAKRKEARSVAAAAARQAALGVLAAEAEAAQPPATDTNTGAPKRSKPLSSSSSDIYV
ncbi:hypothetical protein HYPSUDRAFT_150641 [Hypholoma sublateritium FD-334 SS-4]|uniref:CCHC-type domain-containing protein n=1 Tax=Hypholoma sublateritium (strain FD-334 SS-4) TaxID=945553 RepID=A0A0D2LTU4_HYPSF|nr:hypothetical protein HYPSUDRAFT_150641 [Hypholoma sublateritium FD-334 SS-4]